MVVRIKRKKGIELAMKIFQEVIEYIVILACLTGLFYLLWK